MIRAFFVEIVFPALVFFLVISIVRTFFRGVTAAYKASAEAGGGRRQEPAVQPGGELKKDPVCGTYVSTATSLSRSVNGQAVYFCSEECRKKYRG